MMDPELARRRDAAQAAREEAERLDSEFREFQQWFQRTQCRHEAYTASGTGDCHSSGYDYTCDRCGYWTLRKPLAGTIRYM